MTQSRDGNEESRQGLAAIIVNAIASAAFFALSQTRLVVDEAAVYFRVGASSTGVSSSLSMALFGVGHLVGISVGMAMFVGIIIGWGILVPILTAALPAADSAQHVALAVFRTDIRFFGAGVIGVAALWTFSTHSRAHRRGPALGHGRIQRAGCARPRAAAGGARSADQDRRRRRRRDRWR